MWGQLIKSQDSKYQTAAYVPQSSASYFRGNPLRKDLFVKFSNYTSDYPFAIGEAFYNAGVDVHAIDSTISANLGQNNIGVVAVNNEQNKFYATGTGHITKRGIRDWEWDTKGSSLIGNAIVYGTGTTYQKALDYYFSDKPYIDGWGSLANGVLDPIGSVGDKNDNGVLDAGETSLAGDLVTLAAPYAQTLTAFDINKNGMVELPVASDPNRIYTAYEYTRAQVLKHTITHEMGHAVGMSHSTDSTCVMYQYSNNWSRDGKFSSYAIGQMKIHNP
jgi:hypothetical protein